MRILMLAWEYPPRVVGGIARVVEALSKELAARGHEVHVVTWLESNNNQFDLVDGVFVHRVHMYNIEPLSFIEWVMHLNFAMIEKGSELVQKLGKFDIIHAHDWLVMYSGKALKHAHHMPLVSTIHATEYGRNHGIHEAVQKYINDAEWLLTYESWRIICNSEYMKNEIVHIFNADPGKVDIVPNGIDIHKFDGIEKDMNIRRTYASDNEKIVFFAGRLVQEKGLDVLIEAVPKIISYYHDVKFVIAGKGPKLEELRKHAKMLGVENHIYFTGHLQDNLYKIYKCADVAVFPSLYEPFGIVALESMIAGIPTVVADTGGLGEIVENGVTGYTSYTGNSQSLADAILEVLFNYNNKNEKIIKNATKKVEQLYNWQRITDLTLDTYNKVYDDYIHDKWSRVSDNVGENKIKKLHRKDNDNTNKLEENKEKTKNVTKDTIIKEKKTDTKVKTTKE